MPIGNERYAVQNPFIRYAEEAGWIYLEPEQALNLRQGVTSPVLDSVLIDQLQRLNPQIMDNQRAVETVQKITRVRPTIEGNLDAWEFLKGLKTLFIPEDKRELNFRLLDLDNIDSNTFHVSDEFTFSNDTPPDIRTDISFFINGIPVIIVETKAATRREGISEAFDDIRYYHREGAELMAVCQLHSLTHLHQFYYGATWNLTRKGLFNWRDEQAGDFETLCKTFVSPRRVLEVLTEYILFVRKDEELQKAVLRPHQMRAVERCLYRAWEKGKRRGLVWHTQGSGKTYTMITFARQLIEDPRFENPTVLMLIDRNELEDQLGRELDSVGFRNIQIATTKDHLKDLLASDRRGLIVSMIHKFEGIPSEINPRENFFVLVDEAHRTTGGDLGNYLMGALTKAIYIGFTGTPIDKTQYGKGTFKVFGIHDEKGYLDKYSIAESVADGTTVPLHYSIAPNELQVDRDTLEKEFFSLAELEGVSDIEELNKVLERAVTLRTLLKEPERMQRVARFVADHFTSTIEPMGYKAFLVAVDREACALYKDLLDQYLPAEYSEVVISSGGKKDPEILKKHHLSADQEKAVRKAFRRSSEQPQILIVTEKLLTGFDAPILYCIYLDKPMRDHVLLQAIARVNRPYEDDESRKKPAGFVLDFVGIFENLEKALAFDSEDVKAVVEGIDVLKDQFELMIGEGKSKYLSLIGNEQGDKAAEAVLEFFRDEEKRGEFYKYFKELQDIYEIISPDAFLRPFIEDYNELSRMYRLVRAGYERSVILDKDFLRKTEKLVQQHTESGRIESPEVIHKLDSDTLEKIAGSDKPDTVKIFNLLKALHDYIQANKHTQPYLINIGEKAEAVAEAFERRQKSTKAALDALTALIGELRNAEQQRDETGLSPEAFAVYWYLKKEGIGKARNVAQNIASVFEAHPHWQTSAHQETTVRKAFYKILIDADLDSNVAEIVKGILRMLRRAAE